MAAVQGLDASNLLIACCRLEGREFSGSFLIVGFFMVAPFLVHNHYGL